MTHFYPDYPQPVSNVIADTADPKMPIDDLMTIYDDLTAVGLYVIPKQRDAVGKKPVFPFWNKKGGKLVTILSERSEVEKIQRRDDVSGWCVVTGELSGGVIVVDLDPAEIRRNGENPQDVYIQVQELSTTRFVLRSPANGVHLYYRLPSGHEGGNRAGAGIDVRGDGGYVVARGGYNRYTDKAAHKGVEVNHTNTYELLPLGVYTAIPEMSQKLYDFLYNSKRRGRVLWPYTYVG